MQTTPPNVVESVRAEYSQQCEAAERELRKLTLSSQDLQRSELLQLRRHLLDIERGQVLQAFQQGELSRPSQQRLLADIDDRESIDIPG